MKIGAILVLYNPDTVRTAQVVERLLPQVDAVCAIDNSDNGGAEAMFKAQSSTSDAQSSMPNVQSSKITYISLGGNLGIAKAQNVGIRHFKEAGFDYVIFIDQDTLPEPNTVERLLKSWQYLDSAGIKVGAVAPIAIDSTTQEPVSYSIARKGETYVADRHFLEVIHTMSSLSLVSLSLFDEVGYMWEELFIDAVDCEWCWRAAHKTGARFFYDCDIHMDHILGVGTKSLGGRQIHITPPYRMYYQYRNYLWLLRKRYVPGRWLRINGVKYIVKIGYYLLKGPHRMAYLRNITRGIKDGIFTPPSSLLIPQ